MSESSPQPSADIDEQSMEELASELYESHGVPLESHEHHDHLVEAVEALYDHPEITANGGVVEYGGTPENREKVIFAETVTDDQSFERRMYTLKSGTKVTFRMRDEFPTFINQPQATLLTHDEIPHQQDLRGEFHDYAATFEDLESDTSLLIANATPIGVIDLVLCLDPEHSQKDTLLKMRENFKAVRIGSEEKAFLDSMAAVLFRDERNAVRPELTDGLMDFAGALSSDIEKQSLVQKNIEALAEKEKFFVLSEMGTKGLAAIFLEKQPIGPEILEQTKGIFLVRTTANYEQRDDVIEVSSAAEATRDKEFTSENEGYVPRGTVHFSVNHLVDSHIFGNFEGLSDVIVSPLGPALEKNGAPTVLYGVDTWFESGPGEQIKLPESVIVRASGGQDELFVSRTNTLLYKADNFTDADIQKIVDTYEYGYDVRQALRTAGHPVEYSSRAILDQVSTDDVRTILPTLMRRLAVNKVIKENGGEVVHGNGAGTGIQNDEFSERLHKISDALGSKMELHSGMPHYWAEEVMIKHFYISPGYTPIENYANGLLASDDLSAPTRRLYVNDGLVQVAWPKRHVEASEGI